MPKSKATKKSKVKIEDVINHQYKFIHDVLKAGNEQPPTIIGNFHRMWSVLLAQQAMDFILQLRLKKKYMAPNPTKQTHA